MSDSPARGRFVWYDLMTPDPEGAKAFYKNVVGWTMTDFEGSQEGEGGPYEMWTVGEKPVGGLMALPEEAQARGAPPHWLAYVTVPDTHAVVARTTELGGSVLKEPTTMPGVGTFAVLSDPNGAVFAPYTPETDDPTYGAAPPSHGEFSWHELGTTNYEAAFEFYSSLFGWKVDEDMDMGEHGIYRTYASEDDLGFPYGGMFNKPPEMPGPAAFWLYYISVPDMEAAVARVKENGGEVLVGPMEVPGGDFITQCKDPQGAMFALHSTGQG